MKVFVLVINPRATSFFPRIPEELHTIFSGPRMTIELFKGTLCTQLPRFLDASLTHSLWKELKGGVSVFLLF